MTVSRPASSVLLVLAVLHAGCAPEPLPFENVADTRQLMLAVVEPAAEVYWDAVGTIIDANGVDEFAPSTPEEWEAVRNAAMVIAESGNLLLLPGRVQGGEQWVEYSRAMIAEGRRAYDAAVAEDADAVFEVGGDVYLVCSDCHAAYAPGTLRPNYQRD